MNYRTEVEELRFDCELKARNLKMATESILIDGFKSPFLLNNYIQCKNESMQSVEKLMKYLESMEKEI